MTGAAPAMLSSLFDWVVRVSLEASLVAAVVLGVQAVLGRRTSARWRYNLWLLVVARLLLPAVPESRWSPFNLLPGDGVRGAIADARTAEQRARPLVPREGGARAGGAPGVAARQPQVLTRSQPVVPFAGQTATAPGPQPVAAAMPDEIVVHVRHGDLVAAPDPTPAAEPAQADVVPVVPSRHVRPAVAVSAPVEPFPRRTALLVVWLAGVALFLARLLWATLALARIVRRAEPVDDPAALDLLARCAAELRVARPPALRLGPDGFGPALVGCLRPRLVLPPAVLRGFAREELRVVILHELAHLRRRDVALNWLLAVLGAVHWFNPFVWLALGRMRADRELACDEVALGAAGREARAAYGPALLKLVASFAAGGRPAGQPAPALSLPPLAPSPASAPGATGVLDSKAYLRRRIAMIARFDSRMPMRRPLLATALTLLAAGVALTGAVRGQAEPAPPAGGAEAQTADPGAPAGATPSAPDDPAAAPAAGAGGTSAAPGGAPAGDGVPALSEIPFIGRLFATPRVSGDAALDQMRLRFFKADLAPAPERLQRRLRTLKDLLAARRQGLSASRDSLVAIDERLRSNDVNVDEQLKDDPTYVELGRALAQAEVGLTGLDEDDPDASARRANLERQRQRYLTRMDGMRRAARDAWAADSRRRTLEERRALAAGLKALEQDLAYTTVTLEAAQAWQAELATLPTDAAGNPSGDLEKPKADFLARHADLLARLADARPAPIEPGDELLVVRAIEGRFADERPVALTPAGETREGNPVRLAGLTIDEAERAYIESLPAESRTEPQAMFLFVRSRAADRAAPGTEPGADGVDGGGTEGGAMGGGPMSPHRLPEYQLVPGDLLQIVVSDLAGEGVDTVKQARVSPAGTITLPELKEPLRVAGLTEADVQLEVVKSYADAKRLEDPRVLVNVMEAHRPATASGMTGEAGMMMGGPASGDMEPGAMPATGDGGGMAAMPGAGGPVGGAGEMGSGMAPPMGMAPAAGVPGAGMMPGGAAMGGMAGGMPGMSGGVAPAGFATGATGRIEDPADREADARAAAGLRTPVAAEFDRVALTDVLDHLRDAAGLGIVLDTKLLEEAGIDPGALVTLRLREPIPAGQALEWALRSAGGNQLGYAIDRGVVLVSPREQLDRMVITRAYDVSDLRAEPNQRGNAGGQDVETVVRTTVAPGAWAENGGAGSIIRFRGKLLVTTTEPLHREVEKLLTMLRRDDRRVDAGGRAAAGPAAEEMTPEDIANVDQQMSASLRLREEIKFEIERNALRGAQENSPQLKLLKEQLKSRDSLIQERAEWFRQKYKGYRFTAPREMQRIEEEPAAAVDG
jgi:beta-lactamase regulating signal transducer with metallopeptidase domain